MERTKVEDELKLCDVKRVNLGEAFDKIHSQASDLIVFSLQWRDLEDSLKSVQDQVDKRFIELESREANLRKRSFEIDTIGELEVKADKLKRDKEDKEEVLKMLVEECKVKQRSKESQLDELIEALRKTQGELDLKVEHLERIKTCNRELEEDTERKRKDLERLDSQQKHLEVVEDQLDSQQKLLQTLSSELVSKEKDLQALSLDIDLREHMVKSLNNEMESKAKELEDIEKMIHEQSGQYESTKLLVEELTEELASKEKRHNEITEAIHKLSCKQLSKGEKELKSLKSILSERDKQVEEREKTIQHLSNSNQELIRQLKVRQEQFFSRQKVQSSITDLNAEENSVRKKLRSVKDAFRQCCQNLCIKEKELKSLESVLTERNKQDEEGEKKMQYLNKSNEELVRQVKVRQEQVCSSEKAISECTDELEAKRKHCDHVQSLITDLTAEMKLKECHLSSVKKKIQESLEDLQSVEEHKVKLQASLVEHELRAKELEEKDQRLKATEQELAKWVKDYEVKAKQLSKFCQERNMDQQVALTPRDVYKPTWNSRKRGRYDESLDIEIHGKENIYNFENQRSLDKFKIDQIWAIYTDSDKGMPRKYVQIKRIDTSPVFKLHVAPLQLYRSPNLTTHPVSCGRFKLKTGIAEVLGPSSFSHEVKAVKSNVNRFEVYPRKGEIWAMYKNWNITDYADETEEEDLEIVEVVETKEQGIQAMLLTAKVFNKFLYGRCLESKAGLVDIPKKEMNRFSHQVPSVRRERSATRFGEYEWWEVDSKAVLDLSPKKYESISKDEEHLNINGDLRRESSQMDLKKMWKNE